ncbi:MAG TPA: MFS transporter [Kofleriaceae bacterium]|nr:MFS transporter [Kofleriaceae bacterium]
MPDAGSNDRERGPARGRDRGHDRGLWHHANFLRLWAAQLVSAFGSRITRTALPIIAVKTLDQPGAILGLLTAMQLVPGVFLAMVAGGFVDRGRKRRILIAADLARAALVGSLTLAWALGGLTMLQLIVVGAGVGAASALFQITDVAYLPGLIGRSHLAEGNAKLETTEAIAEITGPASGGALIAALGAPLAVAIDAASYLWSALMLGRIREGAAVSEAPGDASPGLARGEPAPRSGSPGLPAAGDEIGEETGDATRDAIDDALPVRTGEDFRIGLRAVFGHPLVRPIVLTLMLWSILGGFFMTLYTPYCLRELGLSEATFGVIIAMGGVGSLAGAVTARALARVLGVGWTLFSTAALSLACSLFIPLAASATSHAMMIGFLVAHQLLSDGFAVAFIVLSVTLRQTVLPRDTLGRANAAVHVCTAGVLPVAALIAGGLSMWIGTRAAVWVGVLIGLVAPIFVWRLRHLKDMPSGDPAAIDPGRSRDTSGA